MKASTPELMKFQKLQRRLKESRRGIIGLLEGLWIAVAKNCPRGNIGRFSNEEIAIMVDWENDADELVAALVDCGWLDQCEVERLVVHDWQDHCPTYVKGGLSTKGQDIAIAVTSSHRLKPQAIAIGSEPVSTYSSLVCSSQAKPVQDSSSEPTASATSLKPKKEKKTRYDAENHPIPKEIDADPMRDAWRLWCKHRAEIKHPLTESQCGALMRQLVEWGEFYSIKAIDYTVSRGWQGLRLPDELQKAKPSATPNSPSYDPSKLVAGSLKAGDPGYDSPEYKKLLVQHARETEARRLSDAKRIPN